MQAIIFAGLKKYAKARLGADAWLRLLREAGVTRPVYAPGQDYPDEEAGAIVAAASKETGLEPDAIPQDFGEFIAPDLVRMYATSSTPSGRPSTSSSTPRRRFTSQLLVSGHSVAPLQSSD